VGQGEGDYVLLDTGSETEHYEYVGAGSGDYQVVFTRVERGTGEYSIDTSTSHFVYIGENQGDYLAARKVRPPTSRLTGGASFRYAEPGQFSLSGEGFLSSADMNTFSPDLGGQEAIAFDFGGSIDGKDLLVGEKELGNYSVGFSERFLGRGFDIPGRLYEADFSRKWGVSAMQGDSGENTTTTSFGYSWPELFDVTTELGFLDRGNGESSRRRELHTSVFPLPGAKVSLERESAEFNATEKGAGLSRGHVKRTRAGAEKTFGNILPQ
jgi:hypothetical protein